MTMGYSRVVRLASECVFKGVFMMRQVSIGGLMGGVMALAGCGGGGGDSTAVAAVALSTANYAAISSAAVDSVAGSDSFNSTLGLASAASTSDSVAFSVSAPGLAQLALTQARFGASSKRVTAQAVSSSTELCVGGGSLSVSENDADGNKRPSSGDSLTIVANNCVAEIGTTPVNGQMTLVLRNVTLDGLGDLVSGSMDLTFSAFGNSELRFNGAVALTLTSSSLTLDFNRLTATAGSATRTLDYAMTFYDDDTLSVTGPITIDGSTYTLSTLSRVSVASAYPSSGALRLADGRGNRVDVGIASTGYNAVLYLQGDEVPDGSTVFGW
ncbi:MAG: hypothetical protein ACR2JA_12545 [Hydrogenophaga sp.]|uniref:hypothetical protein n=1 Tax=Hydrogenophaga sp. TaxID=1904254 RepID=UPI003D9B1E78